MIGIYDYTVLLTYMNFISGILGIIQASKGNYFYAIILLMFAGLCDMFDVKRHDLTGSKYSYITLSGVSLTQN